MSISKVLVVLGAAVSAAGLARAADEVGPVAVVQTPGGVVQAPLFSPQHEGLAVARIEDQVVTLRELADLLGVTHQSHDAAPAPKAQRDFTPALNRLISARLISLEAQDMGFEDQPLFKRELESYADSHLVHMLQERATADVRADPADVERIFRDAVREWKVESLLFAKVEDAKELAAAVQKQKTNAGKAKKFATLAARAIAAKKAQGTRKADWVSRKTAIPQVVHRLEAMNAVGGVTEPFRVSNGWVVARIEEMRYPDSAEARAAAASEALLWAKKRALKKEYARLVDAYVKVEEALASSLDFEAKEPGFEALEKDERVLARIEGAAPVSVRELAQSLRGIFFHSVEGKKVNAKKLQALDALISKRLLSAEAARQHLAETAEHKSALAEHRRNLLFTYYVDKAIAPDVKVTEADARAYYEANKKDFTGSTFYTLGSIGFRTAAAAQAAFDKLQAGADFRWMKANAPDQVPKEEDALALDGTVIESTMSPALVKALAGAKAGDVRLYSTGKQDHVVSVKQVTPPKVQDFEEVRADILAKLQQQRMSDAIQAVADKLRKARKVEVYITELAL